MQVLIGMNEHTKKWMNIGKNRENLIKELDENRKVNKKQ